MRTPLLNLIVCLIVLPALSGAETSVVFGQDRPVPSEKIPTPVSERFLATDDLLAPWRLSKCALERDDNLKHQCYDHAGYEYVNASVVALYNEDGSIWQRLELNFGAPGYFWKAGIKDFVPFATNAQYGPDGIILRLVRESDHWYEVEINENTRTTKFALRGDQAWSRTKWDGWLYRSIALFLPPDHPPLCLSPDGPNDPALVSIRFERVRFLKADGDWAYVEGIGSPEMPNARSYKGWIRWRKGRSLLVGSFLNHYDVPDTKMAKTR